MATNTLILAIIWKNSSFRTPSYILLAGLAATDFASGLITQPLYAAYFLVKFNDDLIPCIAITAFHTSERYFTALTMETITVMAVERWLHVCRQSLITVQRTFIIYGGLLILPAALTGGRMWLISFKIFRDFWESVLRGIFGALCLSTMLLSYFKVYKSIRNHQQQIQASQSCQSTAQPTFNLAKYKKSVYTIVFILAIFMLCYVPNIICMSVIFVLRTFNEPFALVLHVSYTLYYVSSTLNPLLYCCRIKDI